MAAWPVLLVIVLALAVAITLYLVSLLRKAKQKALIEEEPPAAAPPPAAEDAAAEPEVAAKRGLARSFRRALSRLSRHVGVRRAQYRLPWVLLFGAPGSRPRDLLAEAGINLPFGSPLGSESESGLAWWMLDHGVVLDLDGGYVLGAAGRSTGSLGWGRFLRLTQRHRPERPLDAVVLTLTAGELLAARRQGAAGLADLERRAGSFCQKLWQVESVLGIRCPVYVLITGCEALPSFDGFCAALPARHSTEMLGWSNPYALDAAYRPGWVKEAFRGLVTRLGQVQLEVFAEPTLVAQGEEVLIFPEEVAALEEPLAVYLDPLFQQSAYREGLLLRGIYLTGAAPDAAGASSRGYLFHHFLKGLFEHKIFRERGLAEPTRGTWLAKNRRKLATQAAVAALAVTLVAGSVFGYFSLRRGRDDLKTFLEETAIHVDELRRAREAGKPLDRGVVVRQAAHLMEGMSNLDVDRLGSFFLPASWGWLTDFDDHMVAATVRVQEDVIFRAIGFDLERRALELTKAPSRASGSAGDSVAWQAAAAVAADPGVLVLTPLERLPEFETWSRSVDDLQALENAAELYNGLPETRDLNHLARVIEYLFGKPPPKALFEHSRLYREALAASQFPPFKVADYEAAAEVRVEALGRDFYRRLFAGNEVFAALRALAQDLDGVAHGGLADIEVFADLVARIDLVETALAQPELDWARRPTFDLGAAHNETLSEISGSAFLGADLAESLRQEGEAGWRLVRAGLADLESPVTGPLLVQDDGEPRLQLSTDTVFLKAALSSFLDESFLASSAARSFDSTLRPGSRLFWDLALLEEAGKLDEVFKRFEGQTLTLFAEALRPAISDVARAELGARMEDLIARAQRFEPMPEAVSPLLAEAELGDEIESFSQAAKPLHQLADAFGRLRLVRRQQALSGLVAEQGAGLLAEVDRLLVAGAPYRPRQGDFSWWQGEAQVALTAFDVADTAELEAYLAAERERAKRLATGYAQPLVTWLGKSPIVRRPDVAALFRRWEGILVALQEYEAKKPGNAVAELESFITADMARIDPRSCAPGQATAAASLAAGTAPERPPERPAPQASRPAPTSFFLWRRHELARQLGERCRDLAAEQARGEYDRLARFFNEHLAGRFPFAARAPTAFAAEAELADLEAFFELFDASVQTLRNAQADDPAALGTAGSAVMGFCDRMSAVRTFFASYLDSTEREPQLTLDLDVDFRVLRQPATGTSGGAAVPAAESSEKEIGGERIIDWRLAVGDREVSHRDTERHLAWRPGLPVRLGLRWAEDSPRLPAAPWLAADGRTVLYEYRNRWSLLALLAEHPSQDPRPHTLRFEITTEPNPELAGAGGEADGGPSLAPDEPATQVYVRVTLRPPAVEGKPAEVLRFPDFPVVAPSRQSAGERTVAGGREVSR